MYIRGRKQSGFVLLIVMLVITLAGTVMMATVRHNSRSVSAADWRLDHLQKYWAMRSLQELVLPEARTYLDGKREFRSSVTLNGTDYHLVLCDDQAKINVNRLSSRLSQADLHLVVSSLQSRVRRPVPVQLRPEARFGTYSTFDQIYSSHQPADLIERAGTDNSPTGAITFWGDGKINYYVAQESILKTALNGILGEDDISDILSYAKDHPGGNIEDLIAFLEPSDKEIEAIAHSLTDESRAFSLWVIADEKIRDHYALFCTQMDEEGKTTHRRGYIWP